MLVRDGNVLKNAYVFKILTLNTFVIIIIITLFIIDKFVLKQ